MLKNIIEKVEKIISENQNAYMHPALTKVEKVMTGKFLNTLEPLLPDLKKEEEIQQDMMNGIILLLKNEPCIYKGECFRNEHFICKYYNEDCNERIIVKKVEKYYNKKWEEIIKDGE